MISKLVLFSILGLCAAEQQEVDPEEIQLEESFLKEYYDIPDWDFETQLQLAERCRDQGFIREMVLVVEGVLEESPDHENARQLHLDTKREGEWHRHAPSAAELSPPPSADESARAEMVRRARSQTLKKGAKVHRFQFWTDIDKDRIKAQGVVLNQYYERLRNFFGISRTAAGIDVVAFAKRSDYLRTFLSYGKNFENARAFFVPGGESGLLCYYDNPYEDEEVFDTVKHECTHLLLSLSLSRRHIPHWLDEGLSNYFAGDAEDRSGSYVASCVVTSQLLLESGQAMTLAEMIETDYSEYTFNHYAIAWSWLDFLRTKPGMADKLKKIIFELRAQVRSSKEEDLTEFTNQLFLSEFGPLQSLQVEWENHVRSLRPQSPQQFLEWGKAAIGKARRPPKKVDPEHRARILRDAESWLKSPLLDAQEFAEMSQVLRAEAILVRAHTMEYDAFELAFACAEVARRLELAASRGQETETFFQIGNCARFALSALASCHDFERVNGSAFDFLNFLQQVEREPDVESWNEFLALQTQVAQRLMRLARAVFQKTLSLDPAHFPASRQWAQLAMDFAPSDLELVTPHLLFHAELDPDDQGLAALAVAYAASGMEDYALHLYERAEALAPTRRALLPWRPYLPIEEEEQTKVDPLAAGE